MFLLRLSPRVAAQATPAAFMVGHGPPRPCRSIRTAASRQTLRADRAYSVPGSRARIQVSNLFGAQPLRIEDVHLAIGWRRLVDLPGTDRRILFGESLS